MNFKILAYIEIYCAEGLTTDGGSAFSQLQDH